MRKDILSVIALLLLLVIGGLVWASHNSVGDVQTIDMYLANAGMAGAGNECTEVYAVTREVAKTTTPEATVASAVNALLTGVYADEASRGYTTSIPDGVQLRSVQIDDYAPTVTLDFSEELNTAAGSCRVFSIRAQIEHTVAAALAQWYPDAYAVRITVNGGSPDEALQP